MNILVIFMYKKKKNLKKYKSFKQIFKSLNVNCHFIHWSSKNILSIIKKYDIRGIILTGSEYRILDDDNKIAKIPKKIFKLNIPILGLCYGFQYLIKYFGNRKYINSFRNRKIHKYTKLLEIKKPFKVNVQKYNFNHHDYIIKLPLNWKCSIKNKKIIYMAYDNKNIGIQFHPEDNLKTGKIFYSKWVNFLFHYFNRTNV